MASPLLCPRVGIRDEFPVMHAPIALMPPPTHLLSHFKDAKATKLFRNNQAVVKITSASEHFSPRTNHCRIRYLLSRVETNKVAVFLLPLYTMRDIRKTLSSSMDHLHDLVFDKFDGADAVSFGGTIYREGYLFKQSRKMWKFWKTRYFVLRSDGLFYFRSKLDKDGKALGVIPLRRLSVHIDEVKGKGKPQYCLRLGSGHSFKTFYCLCSFSNDERNLWLTSLLTAISQDMVSNCTYSTKYRSSRSSSGSSGDSEPSSSPTSTLKRLEVPKRNPAKICEIDGYLAPRDLRRPTSMAALSELTARTGNSEASPKKSRKRVSKPLRTLRAISTVDDKEWRGSYIDLSTLQC